MYQFSAQTSTSSDVKNLKKMSHISCRCSAVVGYTNLQCAVGTIGTVAYMSAHGVPTSMLVSLCLSIGYKLCVNVACCEDCGRMCPGGQFISDTCGTDVRQGDVCCCKGIFRYFLNELCLLIKHRVIIIIFARMI